MVKLLEKDRLKYFIIILLVSFLSCLLLSGKRSSDVDLISVLSSSNYICLILNNLYIYYMYTRCLKIRGVHDKIITRIGQKKFFNSYVINFVIDIIVYFLLIMLPIYIKFGINFSYINIFIVYLVLNFTCFFVEEVIGMLIFLVPNGYKYIVIPIILNFIFHYFILGFIINNLFGL